MVLIDLHSQITSQQQMFDPDGVHFSKKGDQKVADLVYDALLTSYLYGLLFIYEFV